MSRVIELALIAISVLSAALGLKLFLRVTLPPVEEKPAPAPPPTPCRYCKGGDFLLRQKCTCSCHRVRS